MTPTNKYEIIKALEGKEVQTPDGIWHLVTKGRYNTRFGNVNLLNHSVEYLESMLRYSRETPIR
jgi:hypothetical protein